MDAVGADQTVDAGGMDMRAGAIEEMRGDTAFVLGEGAEPATGMDRVLAQPLFDGGMDHALQAAAMDRELRHVMAGAKAARLAPDLLAVTIEIVQFIGADRDRIEPVEQAEAGEFTDRMRQGVDADAELADRIRLLIQIAIEPPRAQHQRSGEAANAASDDDRFHQRNSTLRNSLSPLPACGERSACNARRVRGTALTTISLAEREPLTPTLSPQERGEGACHSACSAASRFVASAS